MCNVLDCSDKTTASWKNQSCNKGRETLYSNDFLEFKQYRKKTFLMNWYFNYKDGTNNLRLDPNANNAKILHNLALSSTCS